MKTEKLIDIAKEIRRKNATVIAIDGFDGSGKSTLARELAEVLGIIHIDIDDYLEKNQGGYAKYLDYELLKKNIKQTNAPIVIEGVCIFAILEKLKIKHDLLVYIKRLSSWGFWIDDHLCDVNGDIDAFIVNENIKHREFCELDAQIDGGTFDPKDCSIPKLTEELIRYHYKFRPHEVADIIFEQKKC
jgi:shikimate kinase